MVGQVETGKAAKSGHSSPKAGSTTNGSCEGFSRGSAMHNSAGWGGGSTYWSDGGAPWADLDKARSGAGGGITSVRLGVRRRLAIGAKVQLELPERVPKTAPFSATGAWTLQGYFGSPSVWSLVIC